MSITTYEAWFDEALRAMSPPIVAFGVGGSAGRGLVDFVSDLDIFVLVHGADAVTFALDTVAALAPPGVMSVGQTRTVRGHGVVVSFLCAPLVKVEIFVTPVGAVGSWPSPSAIRPTYDPEGQLSCAGRPDPNRRLRNVEDALHDLASDLFHARKCAARQSSGAMPFVLTAVSLSAARVSALRAGKFLDSTKVAEWWARTEPGLTAKLWRGVEKRSAANHAAVVREICERATDGLADALPVVSLIRKLLDELEGLAA